MELLLNLLWAIIAFSAFLILLPRSRGGMGAIVGIACVTALLFPIISVSDDLSVDRVVLEEWSSIRRNIGPPHPFTPHLAGISSTAARIAVTMLVIGLAETRVVPAIERLLPAESDPRSPPHL